MTELEVFARNADGLKKLLGVAWKDLANPLLTPLVRRDFATMSTFMAPNGDAITNRWRPGASTPDNKP
jgi:hypothetical protein